MREPAEDLEPVIDDAARTLASQVGDEADTSCVFELRPVHDALSLGPLVVGAKHNFPL